MINPIRDEKMRRILRLGAEKKEKVAFFLASNSFTTQSIEYRTISHRFSDGPRRTTDRFDRVTHQRFFGFRVVRNKV